MALPHKHTAPTCILKPALLSQMTMSLKSKSWMSTGVVLPNLMALLLKHSVKLRHFENHEAFRQAALAHLLRTLVRCTTTWDVCCMPGVLLMQTPSSATLK
jgi:hypothetical protein